jgi:glucan-binding YG repeat protein
MKYGMGNFRKAALVLGVLMSAAVISSTTVRIPSYAATDDGSYTVSSAWWDDSQGAVRAEWEKAESSTKYRVQLYRGTSTVGNPVTTSGSSHDFSSAISKKGTGNYSFIVIPVKGGVEDAAASEVLEIDSDRMSELKTYLKDKKSEAAAAATAPGQERWVMNPNGTYQYLKNDGNYIKGDWFQDTDGKWYYFDTKSYMVTGWQKIKNYWYYFGKDGALYVNTQTPDGYTVNQDGVWIDPETGNAITTGGSDASSAAAPAGGQKQLDSVKLNMKESNVEPGTIRNAEVGTASNVTVENVSYSIPYEQWEIGTPVTITVEMTANGDYKFTNQTKYSLGSAAFNHANGDERRRTATFTYNPRMTLKKPDGLYITSDGILKWNKVPYAHEYSVVVTYLDDSGEEERTTSKTLTVTKPEADISDYLGDYMEMKVKVTAKASKSNKKSVLDSAAAEITDMETFTETNTMDGSFKTTGGNLSYRDDSGEKLTGWQQLAGEWYYFNEKGNAQTGWFQEPESGLWYYFDENYHMKTGKLEENGTEYFLNDGSHPELPFGAWVEE